MLRAAGSGFAPCIGRAARGRTGDSTDRRSVTVRLAGGCVATTSASTSCFRDAHSLHTVHPCRPAPQTAVVFVLLGSALWVLNSGRTAVSHLPRALVGTSVVIAVFAVIGYAYGISGLTQVPSLTPIALYSALTFIILCLGISAADPNGLVEQLLKSEASGVVAARRLLPITVGVFPILGWLQIQGDDDGTFSSATGVALLVLLSTVVLFVAVPSLTKRLSQRDVQRRVGIEREARLAALVDATNDAVLSSDANGIITSWNRAAEELYGYTELEMVGCSVGVLSPPAKRREQQQMLQAVASGQERTDFEIQSLHKTGSLLDTSVTISRITQAGALIGFCGVSHDNTDRIRARDELERSVRERTRELSNARAETIKRLALAAECRDDDTAQHTERVGQAAARLAESLELDPMFVAWIAQAAALHDGGKTGIPDQLLLKPGAVTADEFEAMKLHTTLGAQLLAGGSSKVLQLGEQIALTHHERWDGSGYPAGLTGEEIPIAGRIVAVVDTFDAMTNNRPYRPAKSSEQALAEISRCSESLFDPPVAAAFLRLHGYFVTSDGLQLAGGVPARPSSIFSPPVAA